MSSNLARTSQSETTDSCECSRDLYFTLSSADIDDAGLRAARDYLRQQLEHSRKLPDELPENLAELDGWLIHRTEAVSEQYRRYLDARHAGAPRRFFTNRAHALYFLKAVAPTKLVDGAWLYGILSRWQDADYLPLIQTYLEELGDGVAEQNHVVLYKKLLATHGCEEWQQLGEPHFVQGAIQLALAHEAEHFLPEIIGYNLGYEQLPLHLLITAYELNELGIDPYYFTLHITIDNASTGHARKALASLRQLLPQVGDTTAFYRRVMDGYCLNDLGANTMSVIASFDLEQEVVDVLKTKAAVGKNMHSDYCRVAGRTVNEWLSDPETMPNFLDALVNAGWITRGAPAENSKFWRLIQGERAEMFGVFNTYEQQMLRDWIAFPVSGQPTNRSCDNKSTGIRVPSFRAQQRAVTSMSEKNAAGPIRYIGTARGVIRNKRDPDAANDFTQELRLLEQEIAEANSKDAAMRELIQLMSPARHHTRAGLMATRMFKKLLA